MDESVREEIEAEVLALLEASASALKADAIYDVCDAAESQKDLALVLSTMVRDETLERCGHGGGHYRVVGSDAEAPPSPKKGGAHKPVNKTANKNRDKGSAPPATAAQPPTKPKPPAPKGEAESLTNGIATIQFTYGDIEYRCTGPANAVVAGFGHFCAELVDDG